MNSRKSLFILVMIVLLAAAFNPSSSMVQAISNEAKSFSIPADPRSRTSVSMPTENRSEDDTDVFGYSRVAPSAYSWIDVSGGFETGINYATSKSTGEIPIGFTFDYYEHSYTKLYISVYGYISFNNENLERSQPSDMPSIEPPNDVIAPLWTVAEGINYVRYQTIGSSPNRQFVVEWNQFTTDSGTHVYTFEVILHENGDITFQYNAMSDFQEGYSRYAGIENSRGNDGLKSYFCLTDDFFANTAEKFIRPADHANPVLSPSTQGNTMAPGEKVSYILNLRNYGAVGTDTYTISAQTGWAVELFEGDGSTPLNNPVTLDQGDQTTIIAAVKAPLVIVPTETNIAEITATSGLMPASSSTIQIINTFPAPFVQFIDFDRSDGLQSSLNVRPGGLLRTDFTSQSVEGDTAVISLPNHNIFYAWAERICTGDYCNNYDDIIKYAILDPDGITVVEPTVLIDDTALENDVRDGDIHLAVTPDGDIGILWKRELYNTSDNLSNYNAYFSILAQDGLSFILTPQNLTNNDGYYPFWDSDCVDQQNLLLGSTPNGNFFLFWRDDPSLNYVYKIYDHSGGTLSSTNILMNAVAGAGYNTEFTLTGLEDNNIFIAWQFVEVVCEGSDCLWETELQYFVMDSSGSIVFPQASILDVWLSDPVTIQLSNGNIIIVQENFPSVSYILLDGSSYAPLIPMTLVPGQGESYSPGVVSVVKGPYGTAVVTLQNYLEDENVWQIFYMLIDSDGTVKTPPIPFFEPSVGSPSMYNFITSETGQGSTALYYDYTPIFTSDPVTSGYRDAAYLYPITTDDGNLPEDTLTITVITKPDWLTLTDNGDGMANLSGTPANAGNYSIVLRVEDLNGNSADQTFEIEVSDITPTFFPLFCR